MRTTDVAKRSGLARAARAGRPVSQSLAAILLGMAGLSPWASRATAGDLPRSIHAEGVPEIPKDLDRDLDRYRHDQAALLQGWLAGRRELLFLKAPGGTSQVYVALAPEAEHRPLTQLDSPVAWIVPHPSDDRMVLAHDDGGDERYHLDLHDFEARNVSRFASGKYHNRHPVWSRDGRRLAFSSDARNGSDLDLYMLRPPDRATGRRLTSLPGVCVACDWSPTGERILAILDPAPDKASQVHLIDVATGKSTVLPTAPARIWGARFSPDDGVLFWLTDRDSEFAHLSRYDAATGKEVSLTGDVPWDVEEFDLSDDGGALIFLANEDGRSVLHILDARTGRAIPAPGFAEGSMSNLSFRPRSREFAFQWSNHRAPTGVYTYDLETGRRDEWIKPKSSGVRGASTRPARLIHYRSFDGRPIGAYVKDAGPRFAGPRPVLIDIHGGPYAQYRPAYLYWEEYLASELGVAIIHPNVRGSTGYGRTFEGLDDRLRREDAVRDVGSLLDWIATQPGLDASRVAVRGGSYGGYMALASMVRYGDRLTAAIDEAGVSDFVTFLKSDRPGAIASHRREFGDERDPDTAAFLREISPLTHASRIRKPLLVIHGDNDARVRLAEAQQIVSQVRKNGSPVWFVRFDGEGHQVARREHGLYSVHARIAFLKRFLIGPSP